MDIHRCRFVPYPPSAINALAFSHTPTSSHGKVPSSLRLAIGRSNGDIEIWDPRNGLWVQESVLKGGKDRSIEGLAWTHDLETELDGGAKIPGKLRLFSIGYSTVVTEWDLERGRALQHSSGNYGEIWCMAAQPRWQEPKDHVHTSRQEPKAEQLLAIGCGDGSLVLHSTADGQVRFERTLPRPSGRKARVLSLAFQSRQKLVAGFSDSTIRIFDVMGRTQITSMSLGAGPKKGPQEILVWSVKCLNDGTIISGDSTGEVKIWDPKTSALAQRIQSHNADILDVAPSVDGSSLLSGGMDRRTVLYRRRTEGKKKGRWAEVTHTRLHSSDVKAIATFEGQSLSVAASGGLDTAPVIAPMGRLGQENSRALPTLPNMPPLDSAPSQRMVLSWWDREVSLWRVSAPADTSVMSDGLDTAQAHHLIAKIAVQGEENITSSSLANDGKFVAIATISRIKVFTLKPRRSSQSLRVHKLEIPARLNGQGAKIVQFSPDSKWLLVVGLDSSIQAWRIRKENSEQGGMSFIATPFRLRRKPTTAPRAKSIDGTHGEYLRSVSRVAWSSDSRIVVTCDLGGMLDTFLLKGLEDMAQVEEDDADTQGDASSNESEDENDKVQLKTIFGQSWTRIKSHLPRLPSAPLILSFRPSENLPLSATTNGDIGVHPTRHNPHPHSQDLPDGEDRLLVVTTQHHLLEYSVLKGQLTEWSRRNPSSSLPQEFRNMRERAMDCLWNISESRQRLWLYGSTWLWMFDLSQDMGAGNQDSSKSHSGENERKRKRDEAESETRQLMSNTSGAGSKVPAQKRMDGVGVGMSIIDNDGDEKTWRSFDPARRRQSQDKDVEDDAESSSGESASSDMVRMRRASALEASNQSAGLVIANSESMAIDKADRGSLAGPPYWRTYKYRPILGIVPMGAGYESSLVGASERPASQTNLEVALIERPPWDLDLAPRWEGNQEWNK